MWVTIGRRLPERKRRRRKRKKTSLDEIRARWELFFYCWRWLLLLSVGTAQAAEVIVALIEGRPPNPASPLSLLK